MRIKRCHQVDEDDVQIIYESPADEECQFIEVVSPTSAQSSKPSGSRTSVITGRKRPALFPLQIPRENAAFKKPALEAGNFEQPTTSQHSGESTFQNSSLWQQPSNSGQSGSAEQIPLSSEIDRSLSVINAFRTVSMLMSNRAKEIRSYSENRNQGCWPDLLTSSTAPNIHGIQESNNATSDNIDFQSFIDQQGETFEQRNSQGTQEQAISLTTLSNIGSIQENISIENNVALVNQPLTAFDQNSQETERQTVNMITEPNLHVIQGNIIVMSDDAHSEALMNQQYETFEDNSQETQQQGNSITTLSNANPTQESIVIASVSENDNSSEPLTNEVATEFLLIDEHPGALEQNSEETEPQIIIMTAHSNPHVIQESINEANDSDYHFRAIPNQQTPEQRNTQGTQPQMMDVTNTHTVQESFVTSDTRQLRTFEPSDPQRQMVASIPECNTAAILGESSTSRNVLSNQISQVTVPLDLTQTCDLLIPTLRQRLIIDGSFLKKTSQHHVWKGPIGYRKKTSTSMIIGHLGCNIYGLKTVSGNMNVNADMWPKQLRLVLIPSHYLLEEDLCNDLKNINRHATIYFEPQGSTKLQNFLINGWMGFISFPPPCHSDVMIVLYIPQKSGYMGFITNNESGFIIKLLEVRRKCSGLQKCLPPGSRQAQTPPEPTSLPLPAHQQPTSSQLTYRQLPLTSHQQPGFPLPSHHLIRSPESDMPTGVLSFSSHIQRSTSHLPTSLPQSSHLPTSLPQSSQLQKSLPQSSHLQTSLPQSSQLQTRPSTVLTCLPRTQQRLINLFQIAQKHVAANKYETVDRHIDACISAIRQRNQFINGAGPSTSQTSNQLIMLQNVGKSPLPTPGSANYIPSVSENLLEIQASEIFSPSLVKKVIKKRYKTTKQSFNSVNELCEAILAYEESKRKSKDSKKSKRDVNEALLCKICMDEQMNIVFEPCGHLSTCLDCSQPLAKCPMCRTIITKKRKIYMS